MNILILFLLVASSLCALSDAHCLRNGECKARPIYGPEARDVHYIYHGESCDCPKYHDVIIQEPKEKKAQKYEKIDIEYGIQVPKNKKSDQPQTRYVFDVKIEQPVEKTEERPSNTYAYKLQSPAKSLKQSENPVRYIFDTRIEEPVQKSEEKPYQGLMTKVDKISMPRPSCRNPNHSETCNCGCQNPSHSRTTCDCNKDIFTLPIIYRTKRDTPTKPPKRREFKLPKLKKIDAKELATILRAEGIKLKIDPKDAKKKSKIFPDDDTPRPKRRQESPCSYSFQTCDPQQKTPTGCPLCYRCRCDPAVNSNKQRFSTKDIRIPYRMASNDEQLAAPTQQEFDYEPSSYTGLRDRDMYRDYIREVISKYPEHMSNRLPDLKDQQQDLMRFIGEMARRDRSPTGRIENEDVRYKVIDNAMELYKFYENAMSRGQKRGLPKNKRGTVLEIIDMTSDEIKGADVKIAAEDFGNNFNY